MLGRVVEVTTDHCHKHIGISRGALTITVDGDDPTYLTLDLIDVLMLPQHGVTVTTGALRKLGEHGIPVIINGDNFQPLTICQPLTSNYFAPQRFDHQVNVSVPLRKQAWATIVTQKVINQASALEVAGCPNSGFLRNLAKQVRSGDPSNIEAQAARTYWTSLLGDQFRRRREQPGLNQALNYGYTVLRATVARSVISAGLNPMLGIHHRGPTNPLRLVDDFIEPYRPVIDLIVKRAEPTGPLTPEMKRILVAALTIDVHINKTPTTLANATRMTAHSWVARIQDKQSPLRLPSINGGGW